MKAISHAIHIQGVSVNNSDIRGAYVCRQQRYQHNYEKTFQ